jgi:hypothetical protein
MKPLRQPVPRKTRTCNAAYTITDIHVFPPQLPLTESGGVASLRLHRFPVPKYNDEVVKTGKTRALVIFQKTQPVVKFGRARSLA